MYANQYQMFKTWLIENDKITSCPNAIDYLYGMNRLLEKRICNESLFVLINNDCFDQIYKMRNHYSYHKSVSKDITLQLAFEYNGKDFMRYIEFEAEQIFKLLPKRTTLYIHQGNIACLQFKHPIEDIAASVATSSDEPLTIHASYCKKCGMVFINKSFYRRLIKQHTFLVANFCELSEDGYSPIPPGQLAAESPLKLCGYSVKEGGLPEHYRQLLLGDIIYNGILSKTEIINYLEHFIQFNGSKENMDRSKFKWKCDVEFVRNLDINAHPQTNITQIRPYKRIYIGTAGGENHV